MLEVSSSPYRTVSSLINLPALLMKSELFRVLGINSPVIFSVYVASLDLASKIGNMALQCKLERRSSIDGSGDFRVQGIGMLSNCMRVGSKRQVTMLWLADFSSSRGVSHYDYMLRLADGSVIRALPLILMPCVILEVHAKLTSLALLLKIMIWSVLCFKLRP